MFLSFRSFSFWSRQFLLHADASVSTNVYKRKDLRWDSREGGFRPSFCHEGGADFSQGLAYGCFGALRGGAEEEVGSLADLVFPCVDLEVEVLRFAGREWLDPL